MNKLLLSQIRLIRSGSGMVMKLWCLQGVAICLTAHLAIASTILFPFPGRSNIIPDNTLRVNSIVTPNGNSLTINGGSRAGGNLFHSFREFSLPTGSEAFFNNAIDVQNIVTRVTGNNISNIDGLIRANGAANLFLLNPNGIVFGPNAQLNIGGSFIASTASSLNFADGTSFSTSNPQATPLLTVSVPVGLGFSSNGGQIAVEGTGHQLALPNIVGAYRRSDTGGLQVQPGRTLALVGGAVNLSGGKLTAPGGRIELGGVLAGEVGISFNPVGLALNYDRVTSFQNIQFAQRAIADASGTTAGFVQLQGQQVTLRDMSAVFVENRGNASGGGIFVRASELLELQGTTGNNRITSILLAQAAGTGTGGNIAIASPQLRVQDGAGIETRTVSMAKGGNISIDAPNSVQIEGSISDARPSYISALTPGPGNAGDITISTNRFSALNGGTMAASTAGAGSGGSVTINADAIKIAGATGTRQSVSFVVSSAGASGDAGSVTFNTRTLSVRDSGLVSTSSVAGKSGQVTINATESVVVSGGLAGAANPSQIRAAVRIPAPIFQQLFNVPAVPAGSSGDVTINTPSLRVSEGGNIDVKNEGIGNAGTLRINAERVLLDSRGNLTATTQSGEGGNIVLGAASLQMRSQGTINATALGTGNGGNISIDADTIVQLENSDITANAIQGRGGNISIRTFGIFGSPESNITATSQFGLSGTVAITNPEVETRSFLVELPQNLVDTTGQISTGCAADGGNTFAVTGRGGLPENPSSGLLGRAIWWDNRDLSDVSRTAQKLPKNEPTPEIVEATGFRINAQGQVELIADAASRSNSWVTPANCQTLPLSSWR